MQPTWSISVYLKNQVKVEAEILVQEIEELKAEALDGEVDEDFFFERHTLEGDKLSELYITSNRENYHGSEIGDPDELLKPLREAIKPDETAWVVVDCLNSDYDDDHYLLGISSTQEMSFSFDDLCDLVLERCPDALTADLLKGYTG